MKTPGERDARAILDELYALTKSMIKRLDDPDYLTECVEKRQAVMDAFDSYLTAHPDTDKTAFTRQIGEILAMDEQIQASLKQLKYAAKSKLGETKRRQQAVAYQAAQGRSAGTFMNYAK